jgi:PAS domain S-box-containing protein
MSLTAKAYIAAMVVLGTLATVTGFVGWEPHNLLRFAIYFALALPASCLKVRLPGVTGTMSVLFVLLLAVIAEQGLPEALMIGICCTLVQSFWHAKARPRPVQLVFTASNIAFAIWATNATYHVLVGLYPSMQVPFRLSIATAVFFMANTLPVAGVIALTEKKSLVQVWNRCYLWTFSYYLAGAAVVGLFSPASNIVDWQVSLVILPLVYVMYRSYKLYLGQLEAERNRVDEAQKHSDEVGALHARSMEALASAMTANATLDAVIQASPLAVMTVDRQGQVTTWNSMAERTLGWSPEETIGRPLPFTDAMTGEIIESIIDETLRGRLVAGFEMKQLRRDGTPFEATVWTAPLRDSSAGISGILIMIADVSDRKRLEEQLRLSQKMEAVGRLAGGIAHDFNNMLTVINGYSAMLVDGLRGYPYGVSQASEILSAGTRAGELISQLLAFSRRQMIRPKPIEVVQLIRDVERMLRRIVGEHIEVKTNLAPDSGWIRADVNQMEAVMLNLATNAQDAMPVGGVLSVESGPVEIAEGQSPGLLSLAPGSYVRISVRDTGHGMDEETQQHIFEPFFTTKETGKGTGLGLSTVYGTVEQNGGRIFVESAPGRGTKFSIFLPRFEGAGSGELSAASSTALQSGHETILLVEDESSVRHMLREALTKAGYTVWEAANGAEAIAQWAARINEIDLVVTDIVMPKMNGLRLAEELRSRRAGTKVVFMSGHSLELINSQGAPDPAPDLLQKPFVPQVLVRKAREILDQAPNPVRIRKER